MFNENNENYIFLNTDHTKELPFYILHVGDGHMSLENKN